MKMKLMVQCFVLSLLSLFPALQAPKTKLSFEQLSATKKTRPMVVIPSILIDRIPVAILKFESLLNEYFWLYLYAQKINITQVSARCSIVLLMRLL
jgi:hypothetical protein